MSQENNNLKESFRIYGIFIGILVVFFGILIGMIFLSRTSWKNGIKSEVQVVLDEANPNHWIVGNFIEQQTLFSTSSAVYELHNKEKADRYYAVIIRTTSLYGFVHAVFVYNKSSGVEFIGFAGVHGRIKKLMEYKSNTKRINYWSSRIPQIVEKAGVKK